MIWSASKQPGAFAPDNMSPGSGPTLAGACAVAVFVPEPVEMKVLLGIVLESAAEGFSEGERDAFGGAK